MRSMATTATLLRKVMLRPSVITVAQMRSFTATIKAKTPFQQAYEKHILKQQKKSQG